MLSCAGAGRDTCLRPSHLREVMRWRLQPTVQRGKLRREATESQSVQASRESEACGFSTSPAAWDTQHLDGRISSLPVTAEGEVGSWAGGRPATADTQSGRLDLSAGLLGAPSPADAVILGILPPTPCPGENPGRVHEIKTSPWQVPAPPSGSTSPASLHHPALSSQLQLSTNFACGSS